MDRTCLDSFRFVRFAYRDQPELVRGAVSVRNHNSFTTELTGCSDPSLSVVWPRHETAMSLLQSRVGDV